MFHPQLRRSVTHKKRECDAIDVYLDVPWEEHAEPVHVDHVLEVQLMETLVREHPRGRELCRPLRTVVNDVDNLNVTTETLNQAKGGKGSIFYWVTDDLRLGKPVQPLDHYVLKAGKRVTRLQKRTMCEAMGAGVVAVWETRMQGRVEEVDADLAERLDGVMSALFRPEARDADATEDTEGEEEDE